MLLSIIGKHHIWVGWNPTKEGYIELSQKYLTPAFRKFYEQLHPELVDFIGGEYLWHAYNSLKYVGKACHSPHPKRMS